MAYSSQIPTSTSDFSVFGDKKSAFIYSTSASTQDDNSALRVYDEAEQRAHLAPQQAAKQPLSFYWQQTYALIRKCWLVLYRRWFWTFFRSLLLPIAFIVFMVSHDPDLVFCL